MSLVLHGDGDGIVAVQNVRPTESEHTGVATAFLSGSHLLAMVRDFFAVHIRFVN